MRIDNLKLYILNAFTNNPSGGNPAGVVVDTAGLTDAQMQAIAAKAGFSETAFVLPSAQADFRVRFFAPNQEVDLCGHATIATFSLLAHLGQVSAGSYTQETLAGLLPVEVRPDLKTIFMTQSPPAFFEVIESEVIAKTLNVTRNALHPELPCQIVSTGLRDILVPIRDLPTLQSINPDFDAVSQLSEQFNVIGYHLFCLDSLHGGTAHCRNLAPACGIPEEAATGTSNGALSAYLWRYGLLPDSNEHNLVYEQGYSMNRPSEIQAKLMLCNGQTPQVQVGGQAVLIGEQT